MPKDVDRDVVPFVFPGKYVVDIEIETQNEFKTYIERYTELETCKLLFYDIDRRIVQKEMDCKRILEEYLQDYQIAEEQIMPCLYQQKKLCLRYFRKNRVSEKFWRAFAKNRNHD